MMQSGLAQDPYYSTCSLPALHYIVAEEKNIYELMAQSAIKLICKIWCPGDPNITKFNTFDKQYLLFSAGMYTISAASR